MRYDRAMRCIGWIVLAGLAGCATAPEVATTPDVTRANGVLRLTRTEVETLLKTKAKSLKTASGKTVTREGSTYRVQWTEIAVPVIAGKERVGQIDRYDGTANLERRDLEDLLKLMEEARVRAKGVRVPDDLASPTLVRCDSKQCAVDLPLEATQMPNPPIATFLRRALSAQPLESATSAQ